MLYIILIGISHFFLLMTLLAVYFVFILDLMLEMLEMLLDKKLFA